jgi:hypothetical protein
MSRLFRNQQPHFFKLIDEGDLENLEKDLQDFVGTDFPDTLLGYALLRSDVSFEIIKLLCKNFNANAASFAPRNVARSYSIPYYAPVLSDTISYP